MGLVAGPGEKPVVATPGPPPTLTGVFTNTQTTRYHMDVMLSDNSKRLLCRAGFLLFCALPTLICLNAVLFPMTSVEWSAKLQRQLGVINQIGGVQVHLPRQTAFQNLLLGADRFHSRLEIDTATLQDQAGDRVLIVDQARGSVEAFWQVLQRMVETVEWSPQGDQPLRLHFACMTFVENQKPDSRTCVWRDLHIAIRDQGSAISASFVPDDTTAKFVFGQSVATLERTSEGPERKWSIDTTGFRIPGWVVQRMVPAAIPLNPDCQLADMQASLGQNRDLWTGEFSGKLQAVDLHHVVGARFGAPISGRLMVHVSGARLVNNRIQFLDGDLHSPAGTIGSQLLHASRRTLGMQVVDPYGQSSIQAYSDLRMGFKLENDQVAIYAMESGAVLNDARGNRMLIAKHGQPWPVSALVKLVAGPAQRLNTNTAALARHLVISPVETWNATERTAQHDEVGEGSFFNR